MVKTQTVNPSVIRPEHLSGVPIEDCETIARLATIFMGLTHSDADDRVCRSFCIASSTRILGEMRSLVKARGL
jgi:hypothetical protein